MLRQCGPSVRSNSIELDLLIACGSPALDNRRARCAELAALPLNWPVLFHLADHQGLIPLLARALSEAIPPDSPIRAEQREVLHSIQELSASKALRSLAMAGEIKRICARFEGAGLAPITFKGPTLALLAYGGLALRDSTDVDLFVPRSQLTAAIELFKADGYAKRATAWGEGFAGEFEIAMQHPAHDWALDLHWQLMPPYFLRMAPARVAERSIRVRTGGYGVRTLRTEDHLLFLAIHAAREGWGMVRFACDIAGLIARCPIDWDDLDRESVRAGCRRAVGVALLLANELCHAPVPREALERQRRDPAVERAAAEARSRIGSDVHGPEGERTGASFHLRIMERARDRARYLWRRAVQPNHLDAEWVKLPDRFWPAYYALRPVRVAGRALGLWGDDERRIRTT